MELTKIILRQGLRCHDSEHSILIGLCHPLDGVANPNYKLLCFLTTIFLPREEGTSF
jgi:hypothetical protein